MLLAPIDYSFTQSKIKITGKVTDRADNSMLIGASIYIEGTVIGGTTDLNGTYRISNPPTGDIKIICRYIGYKSDTANVVVQKDLDLEINFSLTQDILIGKEVLITAQMQGQQAAINQQISSNKIVNIVSKDKIRELPDDNAAESISRLPGISIQRDGGEGSKITIRGLEPKFNAILIDNQRIPATDAENRSVDLSMISSDILAGIQVVKAITPDQDGDAIGGVVNFEISKAREGFRSDAKLLGGYNKLNDDYGNIKGTVTASNRFLDGSFGLIVSGNYQRANRGSDNLNAKYAKVGTQSGTSIPIIKLASLNLIDKSEIRHRYGGNLVLDYSLKHHELLFNGLYSRTDRDETRRRKGFSITGSSILRYVARKSEINTDLLTGSLTGKHDFYPLHIKWQAAYLLTRQITPYYHESEFRELSAYTNETLINTPDDAVKYSKNDTTDTIFYNDTFGKETITDRDITAQIDFSIPLNFSNNLSSEIKFGGKYRGKTRTLNGDSKYIEGADFNSIVRDDSGRWIVGSVRRLFPNINNFYDYDYSYRTFLDGRYSLGPAFPLSLSKLEDFKNLYSSYYKPDFEIDLKDYSAAENIFAGYAMAEINLGPRLMILPGVRVEHTKTNFANKYSNIIKYDENGDEIASPAIDSIGVKYETNLLPMMHARYRFTDWFDLRLAYTRGISRPNYLELVPWERETSDGLERGTPDLKNSKVYSYDIFLTLYGKYGLLTTGGFYKNITNIDYIRKSRARSTLNTGGDVDYYKPENSPYPAKVYGIEIDLQSNLSLLPNPFDGIIFNINFALLKSQTNFPYQIIRSYRRPPSPVTYIQYVDTVRTSRMPRQADRIVNITIGYEKKKFSSRLSLTYQGDALEIVGEFPEADGYTKEFLRWDFSCQYKLFSNFALIGNVNNITSLPEGSFISYLANPTKEEYFGWTLDFGIKYEF
ncbi:MAG: TonB-dependent receptor [Ignavibacteriales bacterium]|nr:TonB-dependent receptor [Ignavibacteriales bacterium]